MPKLNQSTATTIQLGPFLDKTDGVTEEVGLAPGIEVSKAGAAFVARNSGDAVAHDAEGWYRVPLDATDVNTLGRFIVKAQDSANHIPVWDVFDVVPEQDETSATTISIGFLRENESDLIVVGPFISKTTKLPLTSLTVGNITCGIIKDDATNTVITLTAAAGINDMVHIANGYWSVEVTATNVNDVGRWMMSFRDDDVFYPLTVTAFVVEGTTYRSITSAGVGFEANVLKWLGTAVNETTAGYPDINVKNIADDATAATRLQAAMLSTGGTSMIAADVLAISGDKTAADNLEAAADGTTYNLGGGAVTVDVTKISGDSVAADRLEAMMDASPIYTVDDTGFAPTTTACETDATEATADHYNDRLLVWVTGANARAYKQVTDYALVGGRGKFTYDAFTDAPANGDTFILQ